MRLSFAGN